MRDSNEGLGSGGVECEGGAAIADTATSFSVSRVPPLLVTVTTDLGITSAGAGAVQPEIHTRPGRGTEVEVEDEPSDAHDLRFHEARPMRSVQDDETRGDVLPWFIRELCRVCVGESLICTEAEAAGLGDGSEKFGLRGDDVPIMGVGRKGDDVDDNGRREAATDSRQPAS